MSNLECEEFPFPWWQLATTALLGLALLIASTAGRTIEAVVIGIFFLSNLLLFGALLYGRARRRRE